MWKILVIAAVLMAPNGFADANDGRVRALMHSFVLELSRMSPYLSSEAAFTSKAGKETVKASLQSLNQKVQNPPPELQDSAGFRITFGLLADHISKTQIVFEKGEYEYARMRLNGMTNMCAACHTQTPRISSHSPFSDFDKPAAKPTFENSNFLFVIRRYDQALTGFDKLVRDYPKSGLPSDQLSEVYRRKLAIFARIKRDPEAGIQNLREDLKNRNLPLDVKQNINDWISNFSKWKGEAQDPSKLDTAELIAFVAKKLPPALDRKIAPADPELMNLLRLSGLLYERLYSQSNTKYTQELLYYLAACERSLSPLNWYPLNEIYLKECVVKFPKQDFSQKCYDAYRTGMEERFSNRPMPEFVRESINALKDYL
jgi:hypothetical protein